MSRVLPCLYSAWITSLCAASLAMKAGTSTIRFTGGSAPIRSCSRVSLTTFSDTRPASGGHTSPTAAMSSPALGAISGRIGNTVSRTAVTLRWRSIIGA